MRPTASPWLDLAVGRLRLDRLSRNGGGGGTFFPGLRPFLARQESRPAAILRCAPARKRVRRRSPPASDHHRGRDGRGARNSKEKSHGQHRFLQEVRQRVPGRDRHAQRPDQGASASSPRPTERIDNAPSHRVFVGRAEIGAAWSKRSSEGRDYLSLKLDDPSFTAPIFANLFDDEDGEGFTLIWSRSRKKNGEEAGAPEPPPGPPGGLSFAHHAR